MARKIAAVFVICIVLVATFYVHETAATVSEEFRSCFNTCKDECISLDSGKSTACEISCDNECTTKETRSKLDTVIGK
ncbi:hypothetical protein MKW94_030011 [Papaver nudicaule]|uniref:Major pollen allergen Ole e 6-like n=1 Tax=Papaver nudicaule TaxID=74823 RepID=A0AA41S207_PAPNU|nr:hypothetical protein [Papaver nudicaule]